jgi:hypothetical protein
VDDPRCAVGAINSGGKISNAIKLFVLIFHDMHILRKPARPAGFLKSMTNRFCVYQD